MSKGLFKGWQEFYKHTSGGEDDESEECSAKELSLLKEDAF